MIIILIVSDYDKKTIVPSTIITGDFGDSKEECIVN
jgi:hypothetical protein